MLFISSNTSDISSIANLTVATFAADTSMLFVKNEEKLIHF